MSTIEELTEKIARLEREESAVTGWDRDSRISKLQRERSKALFERAVLCEKQGSWEQVVSDCTAALPTYKPQWPVERMLASALAEIGQFEEASSHYYSAEQDLREDQGALRRSIREEAAGAMILQALCEHRAGRIDLLQLQMEVELMLRSYECADDPLGRCWWELLKRHPRDIDAHLLAAIYHLVQMCQVVAIVHSEPRRALEIAELWPSSLEEISQLPVDERYLRARLMEALATYEIGEVATSVRMVRSLHLHTVWRAADEPVAQHEIAERLKWSLGPASVSHPVGLAGLAHQACRDGHSVEALRRTANLLNNSTGRAFAVDVMQEILRHPMQYGSQKENGDTDTLFQEQFEQLGVLAEQLGNFQRAAELFDISARVARLSESAHESAPGEVVGNDVRGDLPMEQWPENETAPAAYLRAAECYEKAGDIARAALCREKSRLAAKLAELTVAWGSLDTPVLGEWDALSVRLENSGSGPARNVKVVLEGPITPEPPGGDIEIGVGETKTLEISFRPDNAGRAVPVAVKVSYEDSGGQHELPPVTKRFKVLRPGEMPAKHYGATNLN